MLLASYGSSERTRELLLADQVCTAVIGNSAKAVDPNQQLVGLEDFEFSVIGNVSGHPADSAVGVIEMPDDSYFLTVPEMVPEEVRGYLAGIFLSHYLLERDIAGVILQTAGSIDSDSREQLLRSASFCLATAQRGLWYADPIDLIRQSGVPLTESIRSLRVGEGSIFEKLPEVQKFNREILKGNKLDLPRVGVQLGMNQDVEIRKTVDGVEIRRLALSVEPGKSYKPHVCRSCSSALVAKAPRLTVGINQSNGFDHHHYHAFCGSFIF